MRNANAEEQTHIKTYRSQRHRSDNRPEDALTALLRRVTAGDAIAFASLYKPTSRKLLFIIMAIINDSLEAEDILQEAYLKIWRNAGNYDCAIGRPMTWMITIARHQAIDCLRKRQPRSTIDIDQITDIPDPSPSAEAVLFASRDALRLQIALARLPSGVAETIRRVYFDGLTYESISENEEIPVATLKSWVRRALPKLRLELTSPAPSASAVL